MSRVVPPLLSGRISTCGYLLQIEWHKQSESTPNSKILQPLVFAETIREVPKESWSTDINHDEAKSGGNFASG